MTTPAATLHTLADTIADLPAPSVQLSWSACDDDTLAAIVAAFPGEWSAHSAQGMDWLAADVGDVHLTAFAVSVAAAPSRLAALVGAR